MKTLKVILAYIVYFGTGIIVIDQYITEGAIVEALDINETTKQIILWLLIVLWVLKIVWFVISKILEYKERMLGIKRAVKEMNKNGVKKVATK